MNNDEKEEKLISLLAARRSEAFWAGQKAEIIGAIGEKTELARSPWLLIPASVMAAFLVFMLARGPGQPRVEEFPVVTTAFLEHLDLLDDMDVLEALREEEL
ncbi:MAG: hypothetical protein A2234_00595 [Elusimicrobia bacterium RIFOXYA2_FULL_58_8]|nr:MAG: hypothetical protein A2285_06495 [Elusimicrobia bacterium RIFOXYA12_FULL_57_11]OGS12712.1 MAG: hypothetical protein A2234_00595 [Elusimicrobia bacterium RIFOXYA2_FULL_58_8]